MTLARRAAKPVVAGGSVAHHPPKCIEINLSHSLFNLLSRPCKALCHAYKKAKALAKRAVKLSDVRCSLGEASSQAFRRAMQPRRSK
jgi:hypothetical protein